MHLQKIRSRMNRHFHPLTVITAPFIYLLFCILLLNPIIALAKTKATQRPYLIKNVRYYPIPNAVGYSEKGIASWYGKDFHGNRTSNGERYNMYDMTAAHKTLPMHTILLVTHQKNGRQIVVRVNDRGPFVQGRVIDLSYKAAQELGMASSGIARVSIQAISKDKITKGKDGKLHYPDIKRGNFYVQIGAFSNKDNAVRLEKRFVSVGHQTAIQSYKTATGLLYRVHIYAGNTLGRARLFEKEILKNGYQGAFVVAH